MRNIHVYTLHDPSGDIRYVGITVDPGKRLQDHLRSPATEKTYKSRWVAKLLREGQVPHMTVIQTLPASCWEAAERYWIAYFREAGCALTNTTDGGEGAPGLKMSQESRARMSKSAIERGAREAEVRAQVKRCPICNSPRYSSTVRCTVCRSNTYQRCQGLNVDKECKRCQTTTWMAGAERCRACLEEQGLKVCQKCKALLPKELTFHEKKAVCKKCDVEIKRDRRRRAREARASGGKREP
jgi:hypothetical protein